MAITLRTNKGSALTYDEMDKNFSQYFYSASRSGNIMTLYYTGSTNLSGYDPSRTITVDLNPAEGTTPNLVVQGANRSVQFRDGAQLGGSATFVFSTNQFLGIGTAQPSTLVEAQGTTVASAILKLTSHDSINTTNNKMAYMLFNRGTTSVGAIGKVDPLTDNIALTSLTPNSSITLGASLSTNPNAHIFINGQTGNIGVGTYGPGAKLETAINGGSGKTFVFGRGQDTAFNLAGRQDQSSNAMDAIVGQIGLEYLNQENSAIRFHRGGSTTGGYMSFTVNNGSTRMQLGSTGTLTVIPAVNNALALNAEGNAPGQNIYLQIKNQGTTPNSQAVFSAATSTNDPIQFGSTYDGTGFVYNGNPGKDLRFHTKPANVAVSANASLRMKITDNGDVGIGISGTPEGKLHVFQTAILPAAANSTTLLKSFSHYGGSAQANYMSIRDYARRSSTNSDDWYTWSHHNSIDIDGSHITPGATTKTWWERNPGSGSHAFGSHATTTLKVISGKYDGEKNKVLIGQADESKHPNATLSVLHPTNPSIVNVGHTDVAGPHKVVISGGGVNQDYGYYLSGSTNTETFFKTNTGTPSVGELGSNGTTVARINGANNWLEANEFKVSAMQTAPATATATGTVGEIRITSGFVYVCISANTWRRAALTAW